jgi:hypothetical protein
VPKEILDREVSLKNKSSVLLSNYIIELCIFIIGFKLKVQLFDSFPTESQTDMGNLRYLKSKIPCLRKLRMECLVTK